MATLRLSAGTSRGTPARGTVERKGYCFCREGAQATSKRMVKPACFSGRYKPFSNCTQRSPSPTVSHLPFRIVPFRGQSSPLRFGFCLCGVRVCVLCWGAAKITGYLGAARRALSCAGAKTYLPAPLDGVLALITHLVRQYIPEQPSALASTRMFFKSPSICGTRQNAAGGGGPL